MEINEILAQHSQRKLDAEYEAERRLAQTREKIPELARLMDEKNTLKVKKLRERLSGKNEDITTKLSAYDEKILECLKRNGMIPADFLPKYTCKICKDTGVLHGSYCGCIFDSLYVKLYGALDYSRLSGSFEEYDVSLYSDEGDSPTPRERAQNSLNYLKKFADDFPVTKRNGLVLLGKAGLGKSFSMVSLAKEIAKKTPKICYIRAFELFECFHSHRLVQNDFLKPLYDCDIVFIDDLGSEPQTNNVTKEYLFQFIDRLVWQNKHFVIASNLSADRIMSYYGERTGSRIFANKNSDTLQYTGVDLRFS